jgi:hypothetical protein
MHINDSSLSFGETQPISQDIFRIKRQVLVETGNIVLLRADELKNNSNNSVQINVSENPKEDVVIQITNFTITDPNAKFNGTFVNGTSPGTSFYDIKKRTNITSFHTFDTSETLNSTDTLRFSFNQTLFPGTIELNFTNMTFSTGFQYVEYENKTEKLYEPASLIVEVWK